MFRRMTRLFPLVRCACAALACAASLNGGLACAQDGEPDPPFVDTGEIDGDLSGWEPPPPRLRYAPGVLEDYERKMRAYEQAVAAEAAAQKLRDDKFRRESAIYEQEMAAYRAAKRKYDVERAEYEAELARRR